MSDHVTTLIPTDPRFIPSEQAQHAAAALLREIAPEADEVASEVDEVVQFRDCGGNFERVGCPRCGRELDIKLWGEWMSADFSDDEGFGLSPLTTPCCGATATLNDLDYEWAQGFSRYALRAVNPSGALDDSGRKRLESLLGCKLRVIRQRI